jgi:phosphoenolpyruvate carboxykinase (GTP)
MMGQVAPMNEALRDWVRSVADVTRPDTVVWMTGDDAEARAIERDLVERGTLVALDQARFPRSFVHRSDPSDVARNEQVTFICSRHKEDAGPTNRWMSPDEATAKVWPLFRGAMRGRTMYVIPYLMGPPGSPLARVGVELTDSGYVALNMRLMTRAGQVAQGELGASDYFVRGVHSLGDLHPERRFVCHFPETRTVWSIGTGYGGNAMLSKKSHGLRLASVEARQQGWLAEHMLVLGVTDPRGHQTFVAAAFPSKCGKTNLAMIVPRLPGYRVETIGDDICWMRVGSDGRLWAINPEHGMFGALRNTNERTNPGAMRALRRDALFTNAAVRADRSPWWEGMGEDPADGMIDWRGETWRKGSREPASHANARFTIALRACPTASPRIDDPEGVPISAIIFGGRRADLFPLVVQSMGWEHGVYLGATLVSETTAATMGATGIPRHDPMAMLPFCGYHMADYFAHWLTIGRKLARPPLVFHVNWFRRGPDGKYLWPGFGENARVLKWICERVRGEAEAERTIIGDVPTRASLDLDGLDLPGEQVGRLLAVDPRAWRDETDNQRAFLDTFGPRLPHALTREHEELVARIREALI